MFHLLKLFLSTHPVEATLPYHAGINKYIYTYYGIHTVDINHNQHTPHICIYMRTHIMYIYIRIIMYNIYLHSPWILPASMPPLLKWWNPQESRQGPPCSAAFWMAGSRKTPKVLSSFKKGFLQLYHIIHRHHWHHHYIIIIYIYIYLIYKLNRCSIHLFRSSSIERTDLNWHLV